ncbi:response regulator transcription factor [Oceanobacillus piezotolerans]|nr:response regulator transcription factor [Oceanobacillus piezotolerans]
MNQSFTLIEELQSIYAANYGVAIWITDENGEMLLEPKGDNSLYSMLLRQEHDKMHAILKKSSQKEWSIHLPFFFDILPGIYTLTSSILTENGGKYQIWAGMMMEDQSQELLKKQLEANYPTENLDAILINTPVLNASNKQMWIDWMEKFSRIATHLFSEDQHSFYQTQNELFKKAVQARHQPAKQVLMHFKEEYHEFDFIGMAKKQKDKYQISEIAGEGAQTLEGAEFFPGEGFLGRVLLTDEFEYWEGIDKDPRSVFFQQFDFHPLSLFCAPMKQEDGTRYVLFGGNLRQSDFSVKQLKLAKALAITAETHSLIYTLQTNVDHQLHRLSALIEVSKLMANASDMKKVIYMLVDIGLSLIGGSFSCLLLKDSHNGKVKLISRGKLKMDTAEYAKNTAGRYFMESGETKRNETRIFSSEQGDHVFECVISSREKIQGVLCIATEIEKEALMEEQLKFLETLAVIGGISLQLTDKDETEAEDRQVHALYRAVQHFNQDAYSRAEEAAELAANFVVKLGINAPLIKEIIHACRLSYYSPDFIGEMFPDKKMVSVMKEGKNLIENNASGWVEASVGAQVYALVMQYILKGSLEAIPQAIRNTETVIEFTKFIDENNVMEQEFQLSEDVEEEQKLQTISSTIKEMNLSPREQEVLDLVIQGLNNKEIAQELYISGHTVKNHVTKIFQKLEVPDRAHAISKVYQLKYKSS